MLPLSCVTSVLTNLDSGSIFREGVELEPMIAKALSVSMLELMFMATMRRLEVIHLLAGS